MTEKFLDKAFGAETQKNIGGLYADWADTYEAELAENGYATPRRVAQAMAMHCKDHAQPVLDYGCGTGLSGVALNAAGFTTLDGLDPSPEMLEIAEAKGIYRKLSGFELDDLSPIPTNVYHVIGCIGVISVGAAPPETLDMVLEALAAGGLLGLSFNDASLAEPTYEARLQAWLDDDRATLLFKEYGAHLPARNVGSNVYVIEKA